MNKSLMVVVIVLNFVGLLTMSCESDDIKEPEIVKLNFDEIYQMKNIEIKFDSVSEGRCPSQFNCIWAGNASILFNFKNSIGIETGFTLHTYSNNEYRGDTLINGYRIKLIKLLPYPENNEVINQHDYKVELEISKELKRID
ncbi:hypothetical protein JBL43_07200 [Aureibaculum sp. A20]|uniref:Uncharacterized protein n=1 Tax=Aureibaculum flavum TaxID=2795986 RepID=A0ABS0WPU7_9FLAO|nr:hypothetical protein [Aureibaculum flavum]MBJ2174017.1 hypothetical protein [Aureibaculum flavum]